MAPQRDLERRRTGDGVDTLFSPRYRQTYHSLHSAGVEARHVFLDATGGAERLGAGHPTRVLGVGFGTGLNFLLTAERPAGEGWRWQPAHAAPCRSPAGDGGQTPHLLGPR